MIPKYKTRSADYGEPSILWIGKSGRTYRTLVAAKTDKEADAWSLPETVVVSETKKNTLLAVIIIAVLAILGYKLLK